MGTKTEESEPDQSLFLQSLPQTFPECGLLRFSSLSGSSDYFLLDTSTRALHLSLPTEQLLLGEGACDSYFSVDAVGCCRVVT